MSAAPQPKQVKSETVTLAVQVVHVENLPEPQIALTVGGETTALSFLDGLRLCHAMTTTCEELKEILDARAAKAILQ